MTGDEAAVEGSSRSSSCVPMLRRTGNCRQERTIISKAVAVVGSFKITSWAARHEPTGAASRLTPWDGEDLYKASVWDMALNSLDRGLSAL